MGVSTSGDREVLEISPEHKLFGRFFNNVSACLRLIKETNSFSTGGAVLHTFKSVPNSLLFTLTTAGT